MVHAKLAKALEDPGATTHLDLTVRAVEDLDGIEELTELTGLRLKLKVDELPDAVFSLRKLQSLHIQGKTLSVLPAASGRLRALRFLDVSSNRLTALPEELGSLAELRELSASDNAILSIPDLSGLTKLDTVDLRKNRLTAVPPSLASLPIRTLGLAGNRILPLPERLSEWTTLEDLDLANNPKLDLSSFTPPPSLRILSVAGCKLTRLPPALFECRALKSLSVSKNPLGALPAEIGKLENLTSLYAWGCKLRSLPEEIGGLRNLVLLEIEHNELSTLPASLGRLSKLRELHIEKNRFADLPDPIFELEALTQLIAHDNSIRVIPDALGRLEALEYLRLEDNPVEGFPEDLSTLGALKTFYVGLRIPIDEVRRQVKELPPQAFIMSHGKGDIARDGRWSSEPAPAAVTGSAELHVFHHEGRPTDGVFVAGGVASLSYGGLHVFDRASGEERFRIPEQRSLAASPSGEELLVANGAGQVTLLNARTGDTLQTYEIPGPVGPIGFTHDGASIFVSGISDILFVDRASGEERARIVAQRVASVSLSPDDATVAYASQRSVHLVDRASGSEKARVVVDKRMVRRAVFGPRGDELVVAGVEPGFVVVDLTKKKPKKVRFEAARPTALDLSPDGNRVLTGEEDHVIRLWDRASGELLQTLAGHAADGPIDCVRFSADGNEVLSVACDKTLRVWRL